MSKKVKAELLALKDASKDHMLHPDRVVAWARSHKNSALYRKFDWNDNRAANKYRLWQARQLIQLTIVTEEGAPQFVSLSIDRGKGGGYRDITDVTRSRKLTEIMLRDALTELQRTQERYKRVRELASVWVAVGRVRTRVERRQGQRPALKLAA